MNTNPNIFTSLDLEMNQPSGKIIQIGAVIGKLDTGEILEKIDLIVDPKEPISEFIVKLTGITGYDVKTRGMSLHQAYTILKEAHLRHKAFLNPITWGGGDSQEVFNQLTAPKSISWGGLELRYKRSPNISWCFGRRWIDVKTLYIAYCLKNNIKIQSGLAKSIKKMGFNFQGTKHQAPDDALNTFVLFRHLINNLGTEVFK